MNKIRLAKRAQVLARLCEGVSMRSIERIVGLLDQLAGAIAFAFSANAAPIAPVGAQETATNIINVAGGCGGALRAEPLRLITPLLSPLLRLQIPAVESALIMGLWSREPAERWATPSWGY
jgi:hypothetical protein